MGTFATVNLSDDNIFGVSREAERRANEFNGQELANTAWAFAKVKLSDEKLFRALAREAERRVSDYNAQEFANMAWVFAEVNLFDEKLFRALAREAERRGGGRRHCDGSMLQRSHEQH